MSEQPSSDKPKASRDHPAEKVPLPQTQNARVGIDDKNRSTQGGPPAWLAFSTVFLLYLPIAILVILFLIWLGFGG